jgi:transposase
MSTELYRSWASRLSVTMRQAHVGGDKLVCRLRRRHGAGDRKSSGMGADPVGQRLGPAYDTVVLPARPRRPRDKAKVEVAGLTGTSSFGAPPSAAQG